MNYIRFSQTYNVTTLTAELEAILQEEWPLHFNTKDFNGDWRSISLRSASGESDDIYAHANGTYIDTPVLARMPYVQEILNAWECEKETVRLLSLAPGSVIKPHKDPGCAYHDGQFRIHIPIVTNPEVYFTIEDEKLQLKAGECWYMNFSATHSIVNQGSTARIHLVIDGLRNDWTDQLFSAYGYDLTISTAAATYDAETKAHMIAELEKMGTSTARDLIARLKADK
ncbi:aspartyl/asparaginyl beta-hydroxylase domain-containing protein [Chitinophaga agrisoli]|uniref:Aspartyl/asparaginyl beta-hydroxylase domain-containing protein n=1 Tax=Chitinophaga agrisoli TaxID=2607653 RepID=A0A5B2VUH9_9BACT|nr:aspartyl/asparaginyl beta-hydroxylase domain-containing protein [Chitinophaga agrisoli]KAA2241719.1 aspartyl/asparaginyl beta-hydroxylase domain-containing protein [Chitinophaga agrisoli]